MVVDHFTLPTSLLASLFNAKNGSNKSDTDDMTVINNKSLTSDADNPDIDATDALEPPATDAAEPPATDAPEPPATDAPEPPATDAPAPPATDASEPPATDAPAPPATDAPEPPATLEPPLLDENDNLSTPSQPVEQTPTDGNDDTDEDAAASSNGDIEVQVDNIKEVTSKNAQEYADSHTNRELKDMCKRLGLNASGRKLDLASRILSHNGSAEPIVILEG
jgi:hypothetical protein